MDRKLKYWLLASFLLWPFLAAALAACFERLPTSDPPNPFLRPHDPTHNWLGQGAGAVLGYALLLLVVIYAAKFSIGCLPVRWARFYFFALLIVASLPYIWLLVVLDWRNIHVYRFACWVYDPIGILFIPTVSFTADALAMRSPRLSWYVGRSCIEFLLMVPWMFAWAYVSFFILGRGWI